MALGLSDGYGFVAQKYRLRKFDRLPIRLSKKVLMNISKRYG